MILINQIPDEQDDEDDEDDDEDEQKRGQEFYTGGEKRLVAASRFMSDKADDVVV